LVPTLVLWAIGSVVGYLHSLELAHEAYDRTLLGSAMAISEQISVVGGEVVADVPFTALEMLRTDAQDRIFYRVTDLGDGHYITGYEDLPPVDSVDSEEPRFYDTVYKDQTIRVVAIQSTVLDDDVQRHLLVQVAETLDARRQLTRSIARDAALVQLLLIATAASMIALGVGRGLAPLTRLKDEVLKRSAHDLTPMKTDAVPFEVAPLIHAINAHTERQRQFGEAQARFVANASHQLKTPLTVLRAQVDHALLQTDLASMRAIVSHLHESTEGTGRLLAQLLSLARSETQQARALQDLDLTELAHDLTFEMLTLAGAKGIDLGFEADGPVPVRGERVLLREMIANLVHNAIVYTPARGRVTVSVGRQDGRAALWVVDNGPGIALAERPHVLERFYRGAGTGQQGSGLGLAIVCEICDRHGIAMQLDDAPDSVSGLRVQLMWPGEGPEDEL
jgi:two-component system sensor histidine kinase TctE